MYVDSYLVFGKIQKYPQFSNCFRNERKKEEESQKHRQFVANVINNLSTDVFSVVSNFIGPEKFYQLEQDNILPKTRYESTYRDIRLKMLKGKIDIMEAKMKKCRQRPSNEKDLLDIIRQYEVPAYICEHCNCVFDFNDLFSYRTGDIISHCQDCVERGFGINFNPDQDGYPGTP